MTQPRINLPSGIRSRQLASPIGKHRIRVTAASRIHFGLMGFNQSQRRFGGVGMMIDQPATVVRVAPSDNLTIHGDDEPRIRKIVASWAEYYQRTEPVECTIEIVQHAPAHIGLGSGTQLALSVARALNAFVGEHEHSPEKLAASVQRARRSSVGSWGFHLGGCIVELGHQADQKLASDYRRALVPEFWRVLLGWPLQGTGLHGPAEESAFAALAQIPADTTARLERLALESLLPALQTGDFDTFSNNLFEYGLLSGSCFASIQGGPYAAARSAELIKFVRAMGVAGVGQSSWGPLIFAVLRDEGQALWLRQRLQKCDAANGLQTLLVRPNNQGAFMKIDES